MNLAVTQYLKLFCSRGRLCPLRQREMVSLGTMLIYLETCLKSGEDFWRQDIPCKCNPEDSNNFQRVTTYQAKTPVLSDT